MMKQLGKLLVIVGMISALGSVSARAELGGLVTFSVLGGLNAGLNNGGGLGYLGGAEIGTGLGGLGASVGAEYLSRSFTGISNVNWLHIPALVTFPLFPMLSVGAGGFYDFALTANAGSHYGAVGSLKISPVGLPLFVEGRFNYGFNTSAFPTGANEIQALVGFNF